VVAAKIERNERVSASANIGDSLPPEIRLITPSESTVTDGVLRLQAVVTSPRPIEQVVLYLNGVPRILKFPDGGNTLQVDEQLTLLPGKNTVFLAARDGKSIAKGVEAEATSPVAGGTTGVPPKKPNLYVLAVGIKKYADPNLNNLNYADKDAEDFVKAMDKQKGSMFGNVESKLLLNEEVTPGNLREAIDKLKRKGSDRDYHLLFLSGHGAQGAGGYYFLCHDHKELESRGDQRQFENDMLWYELVNPLTTAGMAILIVDTCHAAATSSDVNFDPVLMATTSETLSLTTYAASRGREKAQELPGLRNGVFTKALLEELSDKSLEPDGFIFTDDLGPAIRRRVTALIGNKQHPVAFILPIGIPAYPLFARPAKSEANHE